MRRRDLADYMRLRPLAYNPWDIVRFRKKQPPGRALRVQSRQGPPLHVRGGTHDYHLFHRTFLKDEYRVNGHSGWDCVLDLGANVGYFSARVASLTRRVISYEPVPETFEQLELNTRGIPNVTVMRKAIAAKPGPLRVYRPRNAQLTGVHSSFPEFEGHMSELYDEVEAVTLDQVFSQHGIDRCDLLKLDVEGQEYEILYSVREETLARIQRIHGEYHDVCPDDPRTRIASFESFLKSLGFETSVVPSRKHPNLGLFFATRS